MPSLTADFEIGSEYRVTVDGRTITATKTTTAETVATMADALNAANSALTTSARDRFERNGGALHFVYDDAVGNHTGTEITDVRMREGTQRGATEAAMNTGVTGTDSVAHSLQAVIQVTKYPVFLVCLIPQLMVTNSESLLMALP